MGDLRRFLSFSFPTLSLNFSLVREALFSLCFLQRPVEVSGECWKTPPRNPVSSAVVCHRRWHRRRQKQIKPLFLKFFYAFHPFFPLYSILPSKFPNPNLKPLDLETKRRMEKKGKKLPSSFDSVVLSWWFWICLSYVCVRLSVCWFSLCLWLGFKVCDDLVRWLKVVWSGLCWIVRVCAGNCLAVLLCSVACVCAGKCLAFLLSFYCKFFDRKFSAYEFVV